MSKIILQAMMLSAVLLNVAHIVNADEKQKKQHFETDWLKMEKGHVGSVIGAEVTSISLLEKEKLSRVEVALPRAKGRDIEEVVVIGRRDKLDYRIDMEKDVTIIKDYDNGRSGIVIHLNDNLPFKLLINYVEYKP